MIRRSMEGRVAIVAGRMHDHSACLSAAGNEDYAWQADYQGEYNKAEYQVGNWRCYAGVDAVRLCGLLEGGVTFLAGRSVVAPGTVVEALFAPHT